MDRATDSRARTRFPQDSACGESRPWLDVSRSSQTQGLSSRVVDWGLVDPDPPRRMVECRASGLVGALCRSGGVPRGGSTSHRGARSTWAREAYLGEPTFALVPETHDRTPGELRSLLYPAWQLPRHRRLRLEVSRRQGPDDISNTRPLGAGNAVSPANLASTPVRFFTPLPTPGGSFPRRSRRVLPR